MGGYKFGITEREKMVDPKLGIHERKGSFQIQDFQIPELKEVAPIFGIRNLDFEISEQYSGFGFWISKFQRTGKGRITKFVNSNS